jgi:hypothetical protein
MNTSISSSMVSGKYECLFIKDHRHENVVFCAVALGVASCSGSVLVEITDKSGTQDHDLESLLHLLSIRTIVNCYFFKKYPFACREQITNTGILIGNLAVTHRRVRVSSAHQVFVLVRRIMHTPRRLSLEDEAVVPGSFIGSRRGRRCHTAVLRYSSDCCCCWATAAAAAAAAEAALLVVVACGGWVGACGCGWVFA